MIQSGCRQRNSGGHCRFLAALALILLASGILPPVQSLGEDQQKGASGQISKSAADSCDLKVKSLQAYAGHPEPGKTNTTIFSESEINSYLALDLSPKYSPALKSLVFSFGEASLKGSAIIDFDVLGASSKKFSTKLFAGMFAGAHNLTVRGKLTANAGKTNFQLEEARFDQNTLPNFLVEEIITAVGRKQKPPFDPMQPSQMPYHIEKVGIHQGYILVYQ